MRRHRACSVSREEFHSPSKDQCPNLTSSKNSTVDPLFSRPGTDLPRKGYLGSTRSVFSLAHRAEHSTAPRELTPAMRFRPKDGQTVRARAASALVNAQTRNQSVIFELGVVGEIVASARPAYGFLARRSHREHAGPLPHSFWRRAYHPHGRALVRTTPCAATRLFAFTPANEVSALD